VLVRETYPDTLFRIALCSELSGALPYLVAASVGWTPGLRTVASRSRTCKGAAGRRCGGPSTRAGASASLVPIGGLTPARRLVVRVFCALLGRRARAHLDGGDRLRRDYFAMEVVRRTECWLPPCQAPLSASHRRSRPETRPPAGATTHLRLSAVHATHRGLP
jgi:hypothetical protein